MGTMATSCGIHIVTAMATEKIRTIRTIRARSQCNGNGIIFIILVPSLNGFCNGNGNGKMDIMSTGGGVYTVNATENKT